VRFCQRAYVVLSRLPHRASPTNRASPTAPFHPWRTVRSLPSMAIVLPLRPSIHGSRSLHARSFFPSMPASSPAPPRRRTAALLPQASPPSACDHGASFLEPTIVTRARRTGLRTSGEISGMHCTVYTVVCTVATVVGEDRSEILGRSSNGSRK
jgi:hypothetical protein